MSAPYSFPFSPSRGTAVSTTRESVNVNIDTDLPYELRALEAALAEVNKVLEHEVTMLEKDAWASLENLTKKARRLFPSMSMPILSFLPFFPPLL